MTKPRGAAPLLLTAFGFQISPCRRNGIEPALGLNIALSCAHRGLHPEQSLFLPGKVAAMWDFTSAKIRCIIMSSAAISGIA